MRRSAFGETRHVEIDELLESSSGLNFVLEPSLTRFSLDSSSTPSLLTGTSPSSPSSVPFPFKSPPQPSFLDFDSDTEKMLHRDILSALRYKVRELEDESWIFEGETSHYQL